MDDCDEQGAVCISELHATYQGLVVIKCGGWHAQLLQEYFTGKHMEAY